MLRRAVAAVARRSVKLCCKGGPRVDLLDVNRNSYVYLPTGMSHDDHITRHISFVWSLGIGVVLLLVVGSAVTSADEDIDQPETVTTTLHPGDNFVGWVDESLSLDELLVQLPGIERISTWDAVDQREVSATLEANGRWAGTLQALEPGAAYVVRLGGDSPIEWTRPIVPAAGLVELRTGVNWAAWLGPDDWKITDVAKGIGKFLSEIRLGDHVYEHANPETAEDWPTVSRGDALLVTVSRGVNWLQPTYVLPQLIYAGSVAQGIRSDAERDLDATLAYVTEVFGVQADPYILVGLIPGDARSMFNELERLGWNWELEAVRTWYEQAGGFGSATLMFIKAPFWEGDVGGGFACGRQVLLEEYFHAVQQQIERGSGDQPPTWFIEGSAAWIRADLRERDRSELTLSQELLRIRNRAPHAPLLEEIEERNQAWQYSLGLSAVALLVQRAGAPSMLDFFRALAPGRTGLNGQWKSQLTWQGAFAAAYDISVEEFYAEFEAHMRKSRGNFSRRAQPHEATLKGTVTDANGMPRRSVLLSAIEFENGQRTPYGYVLARADDEGKFTLFVNKQADYRIEVRLSDNYQCRYWWTSEGDNRAESEADAELIEVGNNTPPPLTITVDGDECRWRIAGVLTGPDDEPLAGIEVQAQGDGRSISARTEFDGSFELVTLAPGTHQLSANLDGCRLYWGEEHSTEAPDQAGDIQIVDQDVTDIQFTVPADLCRRVILSGRLLDANSNGIEKVWVNAKADGDRIRDRTDANGGFEITLSEPGEYRLYAFLDGCLVYHREGAATGSFEERTPISVPEHDVSDIVFQLQDAMCTLRVSGSLSNMDGTPKSGVYVRAVDGPLQGGDWPADDGSFSFTVPVSGSYKLSVTIDGCVIYYGGNGASGGEGQARALSLRRSSIANIDFVLPIKPCYKIAGVLLDADGNGLNNISVNAQDDAGRNVADRTAADGSFSINVSNPGSYRVYEWVDGCLVNYMSGGATGSRDQATPVEIADSDVTGVHFQLVEGLCEQRVSGELLNADGSPRSGQWVTAWGSAGAGGAWTTVDGSFSFAVPSEGSYRLATWFDGCRILFGSEGPTISLDDPNRVHVSDADITGIEFLLPEEPASFCD